MRAATLGIGLGGSVPASVGDGHEGPNLRFEIKLAAQFARDLFGLMLIFSD